MHYWGDEWFSTNGDDLYEAIREIETYLRKHHIGICGKEKYGTYRDEHLSFWNGGLYQLFCGYRAYTGTFHAYQFKLSEKDKTKNNWKVKFNQNVSPKIVHFADSVHKFIRYKLDDGLLYSNGDNEPLEELVKRYEKRIFKGLKHYSQVIGLTRFVQKKQAEQYNNAFQIVCKKYPHIVDELVSRTDGYKMIKPNKYGNVDGVEIHNKYWKKIE